MAKIKYNLSLPVISVQEEKDNTVYIVSYTCPWTSEVITGRIAISSKVKKRYDRLNCVLANGKIFLDEYWAYRLWIKEGSRMSFIVQDIKAKDRHFICYLSDEYGRSQQARSEKKIPIGASVSCTVAGFSKADALRRFSLVLSDLEVAVKKHEKEKEEEEYLDFQISRNIAKWSNEVKDLGRHICRQKSVCSCCGNSFGSGKGYRIELRDLYFCSKCMKKIIEPSGRGYINIVYTNMGHKK